MDHLSDLDYWEETQVFKDREYDREYENLEWDDTSDTSPVRHATVEITSVDLRMGAPLASGVDIGSPKGLQEAWWPIAEVTTWFTNGRVSKVTIEPYPKEVSQKPTAGIGGSPSENETDDLFTYSMCEHPTIRLSDRNIEQLTKSSLGVHYNRSTPFMGLIFGPKADVA